MLTVNTAIKFAAQYHAGQVDQVGVNYIYHPLRVMLAVSERCRLVAVLHDVVEDTDASIDDFEAMGLGFIDAYALDLLSRVPNVATYKQYIQTMADAEGLAGSIARTVKRADLVDNLERIDQLPDGKRNSLYSRYLWALAKLASSETTDAYVITQDEIAHAPPSST